MKKQTGLTRLETVLIIILVTIGLLWLISVAPDFRKLDQRFICGSNLKGLGTAMMVYAQDYNDRHPQLPGKGPWSRELGFPYFEEPDFKEGAKQESANRTVTASWYLLVRQADESPRSLVCPYSKQTPFNGKNPLGKDLVDLWDFGYDPHAHVSYALHHPYGRFSADGYRSADFAVAADMNPWFMGGHPNLPGKENMPPQIIKLADPTTWKLGNSPHHYGDSKQPPHGQNVLFADGHTSYETHPNVGVNNDNIYTFWSTDDNPTEQDKQGGAAPAGRTPDNDAKSEEDSFLVI